MNVDLMKKIGIALIFIGLGVQLALMEFAELGASLGSMVLAVGFVLLIRGRLIQKNPEKLKKDERSRKIGAWAASYSWMIAIFALMILFWINRFFPLSVDIVIGAMYIVLVATIIIFQIYFNKKGDIE